MRINHNISAINAWRNIYHTNYNMSKVMEKLSSGLRINRAADDAAGLAISEKMRGQIRGLSMAIKNSQDAISLIQTAEGALNEVHSILQRMRELAVQAATDTNTSFDRAKLNDEFQQLKAEINRIASATEFNTMKLLNGNYTSKVFQVGPNNGNVYRIGLTIPSLHASALQISGASIKTISGAQTAINSITAAINKVSSVRSMLGAKQNRIEHTIAYLGVAYENLTAAESRIRDADMAKEMMAFTKYQILLQTSNAMLAQANLVPQSVLQLMR